MQHQKPEQRTIQIRVILPTLQAVQQISPPRILSGIFYPFRSDAVKDSHDSPLKIMHIAIPCSIILYHCRAALGVASDFQDVASLFHTRHQPTVQHVLRRDAALCHLLQPAASISCLILVHKYKTHKTPPHLNVVSSYHSHLLFIYHHYQNIYRTIFLHPALSGESLFLTHCDLLFPIAEVISHIRLFPFRILSHILQPP